MIYVSSSSVRHRYIAESVRELAQNGFKNIELSGGTEWYEGLMDDLLELKEQYKLQYLCHNYFPPPKKHFVLNLASLDQEVYEKTFEHLCEAIQSTKRLGAKKFGFHAGFFIDIKVTEIGKSISATHLYEIDQSIEKFCTGYYQLKQVADEIVLYLENNVFSATNRQTYPDINPFMLCTSADYHTLVEKLPFQLLLDVAHLKVTANTVGLDFNDELERMIGHSDYLHVSDNDGLNDQNKSLLKSTELLGCLSKYDLSSKDITLEIYDDIEKIKQSYDVLERIIDD